MLPNELKRQIKEVENKLVKSRKEPAIDRIIAELNFGLRTFRNRIYHYDPIIWNIQELIPKRKEINEILYWIEPEIAKWAESIDTFQEVKRKIKEKI